MTVVKFCSRLRQVTCARCDRPYSNVSLLICQISSSALLVYEAKHSRKAENMCFIQISPEPLTHRVVGGYPGCSRSPGVQVSAYPVSLRTILDSESLICFLHFPDNVNNNNVFSVSLNIILTTLQTPSYKKRHLTRCQVLALSNSV